MRTRSFLLALGLPQVSAKLDHSITMPKDVSVPEWEQEGFSHIWLPYTQMQRAHFPLPVVGAEGSYIHLEDGRKLLDGIASWWSMAYGYQHPSIVDAITRQANQLSHVMFAGLAHEPAYRLAARLAGLAPQGLERVFFSDSGSTAVEVALKMAVQYWSNQGRPGKKKFLSFKHAYHGDTMGAMSLSDPDRGMHQVFGGYMPRQYVVGLPREEYDFVELENLLKDIKGQVAAMVLEPLVQCAGGFRMHSSDVVAALYHLAHQYDMLFIADEVATGFGRTGSDFACCEAGITPDILCVGKALTGGHIGLAATLATEDVFEAFSSNKLEHALMHGPTYMANPLACAAACAALDLYEQMQVIEKVAAIEAQMREGLAAGNGHARVKDVRVRGAIGAIELDEVSWEQMFALRDYAVEQGVWLRPFGQCFYLMPPFTVTESELAKLMDVTVKMLDQL